MGQETKNSLRTDRPHWQLCVVNGPGLPELGLNPVFFHLGGLGYIISIPGYPDSAVETFELLGYGVETCNIPMIDFKLRIGMYILLKNGARDKKFFADE